MRESSFWNSLRKGLMQASNNRIFLERHENSLNSGTPDVHYCLNAVSGWIELKYLPDYPVHADTLIHLRHFNDFQRLWLQRYYQAGGNAWLILRIKKDVYMIYGDPIQTLTSFSREHLRTVSAMRWINQRVDYKIMLELLYGGFYRVK